MTTKDQIFSHIQESTPLPSLPHILIKLIDVCDNEEAPISTVGPIVAQDTAMSSKVLRLVNSAYFDLQRTFSDLDKAVVFLGASTIKDLAINASVQQVISGLKNSNGFNIGHFWYNSLLSATLGRRIAQAINHTNTEEVYLAGLLHNIGHLILFNTFPKEYTLVQEKRVNGPSECTEEERLIGVNHCEAGAWLIRKWKISPFIADAAYYHHHAPEYIKDGFPLVKITFLADRIAEGEASELVENLHLGRALLGLDMTQMQQILESAKEEVIEIAENLDINIQLPVYTPHQEGKNGKQYHLSQHTQNNDADAATQNIAVNQKLVQQVENSSLLTSFSQNLLQADKKDSILSATEKIIRMLFGCETIFFLLYDSKIETLTGTSSPENHDKELVKSITLPNGDAPSIAFRALASKKILTSFQDPEKEPRNLADVQLFNIVSGKGMKYIPMFVKQDPIGVIVLSAPETNGDSLSHLHQKMQLIANQTATALHLDDMKKREAERLQSERMAAASLAAKKIVHEVNNPLGIISNYLKLLEMKFPDQDNIKQGLHILDEEISRISTIIGQLNNSATTTTFQAETINVNDLMNTMLKILAPTLLEPAGIQFHFSADPVLTQIETEKDTLKQIVINLIKNSAEAMENGGIISIATRNIAEEEKIESIEITIGDNGPGIPENIQKNLFPPFLTTKNHGHSGLGLSITHRAVQDLGGTIACESNKENGTRFTIVLPLNLSNVNYVK